MQFTDESGTWCTEDCPRPEAECGELAIMQNDTNAVKKCSLHGDVIVHEEGGLDKPTIYGRTYCPTCQSEFIEAMDRLRGITQNPGGMIGGVNHDFTPGGPGDTPLGGEWIEKASRRVQTGVGSALCVHGVGLTPGLWCGACLNEAWRREYAPESDASCAGSGCNAMGPCTAHVPNAEQNTPLGRHLPVMGQPGQLKGRCCERCGHAGDDESVHLAPGDL